MTKHLILAHAAQPVLTRVQVDFNGIKTIREIDVFSVQDNYSNPIEPTETTTFSQWGLTAFDVQYWSGSAWATVPGGSVTGNNKVWKRLIFNPINTSKMRVMVNATVDSWTRVIEIEAWTNNINWVVTDHLGTPRMIIDQAGALATIKRHDYLPFGEELLVGTGGRSTSLGYMSGDGVRQQFTAKERDKEVGLDYFINRYYSSIQGRFASVDPDNAGAEFDEPQPGMAMHMLEIPHLLRRILSAYGKRSIALLARESVGNQIIRKTQ